MKLRRYVCLIIIIIPITLSAPCFSQTISLTPKQLYNHLKKYRDQRRDEEWAKSHGRIVRWTAHPRPFAARGITDQGFVIDLRAEADLGYIWLRAYFPEKDAEMLLELSEYGSIIFEGRLADYSRLASGLGYHFLIKEAELVEVIQARSVLSIVDYKFNVQPSSLTGDYKLLDFEVTLKNEGELPLRRTILEVNFGHVKGMKRNVAARAQASEEIIIWFMDKWIVNGEKKMPPFHIPSGLYAGIMQLKDESGRLITSEEFSQELPPVEWKQLD